MENNICILKRKFELLINKKDINECVKNGKVFISYLKSIKNLPIEFYKDISYYCEDLFLKGLSLEKDEDRFFYNDFFIGMGLYFCNQYIKGRGFEVFNNEEDINFLIDMSTFYELGDRHDEKFDLLENMVKCSEKNCFKLKAIDQILNIGGLNKDIFDKYQELKKELI